MKYSEEKANEMHLKAFNALVDYMMVECHSVGYDVLRYARKGFYTNTSGETQYAFGNDAYNVLREAKAGNLIVKEAYDIQKLNVII